MQQSFELDPAWATGQPLCAKSAEKLAVAVRGDMRPEFHRLGPKRRE